jgi:hypothetical protein
VGETFRNLDRSLRYSFATNSIPRNPFRDCNPTLVVEPEPKTYKDIQNIHITTYISDVDSPGNAYVNELDFLNATGPQVRILTLNMAMPKYIIVLPEQQKQSVMAESAGSLMMQTHRAMKNRSVNRSYERRPVPATGVVSIRINFSTNYAHEVLKMSNWNPHTTGTWRVLE